MSVAGGLLLLALICCLPKGARAAQQTNVKFLTIGLVADSHYDTFPAGEKAPWEPLPHWFQEQIRRTTNSNKRRYDIAKDKMDETVEVFNAVTDMAFAVNLGDLVNNDLMWNLKPILDSFNRIRVPHYSLLGNHDLRAHNDRFGKVNKTQEMWLLSKLGLIQWHFSIRYPPFKFLFLDSMAMEPENKNMTRRKEHVEWLKREIEDAKVQKQVVIVFAHISIGIGTNALGPIIASYDHVAAIFCGHEHKGGYIKQKRIHTVILHGQIETMVNAFAILDIFPDRMELTGFGRVPTRIMFFEESTKKLLGEYKGPVGFDLESQGNLPLPGDGPFRGEVLQKPPLLQLNIPAYRKPHLLATEPNPGDTQFLRHVYSKWPKRLRLPSCEDPVDLTSARKEGPRVILTSEPCAKHTAANDGEPSSGVAAAAAAAGTSSSVDKKGTSSWTEANPSVAAAKKTVLPQQNGGSRRAPQQRAIVGDEAVPSGLVPQQPNLSLALFVAPTIVTFSCAGLLLWRRSRARCNALWRNLL